MTGSCEFCNKAECCCDQADLWGQDGDDNLTSTSMDEEIENIMGNWDPPYTGSITLVGFKRKVMDEDDEPNIAYEILETALETFREDYGPVDDEADKTKKMVEAAEAFAKVFCEEYHIWQCDSITEIPVDVHTWVEKNHPDWLGER